MKFGISIFDYMEKFKCNKCGALYDSDNFYWSKAGYKSFCKKCVSINNNRNKNVRKRIFDKWVKQNNDKYKELCLNSKKQKLEVLNAIINEAKNNPCLDCGLKYSIKSMDFDHLGDKKYKISHFRSNAYSVETLKKELSKCDLVCANCHRLRTLKRRQFFLTNTPQSDQTRVRKLQEWVNNFKNKPCEICLKTFHNCQMDFDHIDPSLKLKSVSELVNRRASYKRIEEEISKCRLVCANCHRIV